MARVVWNKQEKSLMFNEMVELLIEEPYMSNHDVLTRSQVVLHMDRRRDVTPNTIFNYKSTVLKAQAEADCKRNNRVAQKAEEPQPGQQEDLLEQLMRRFAKMVAEEVSKRPPKNFHIHHPNHNQESAQELQCVEKKVANPKTSVLVIGLNGHQMSLIKSRVTSKDITFLHINDVDSRPVVHKDHTILMTKFINHAAQSKYRNVRNLHYCNGGVSELTRILYDIR